MIVSIFKIILIVLYTILISTMELLITPFLRTGNLYHALAKLHARGVLAMSGVKLEVEGLDHVEFSRGYIYVSNHASYFDIPAVIAGIPDQIRIVYKKELEKIPIFGWGLKYGKTYIGIDRGKGQDAVQSLDDAAEKIRNGASVILFAEGTRTPDGNLQPFKRGPFNLAVKAQAPVVPVAIHGSRAVLPKDSWRIRPGTIKLILSEPIDPPKPNGKESEFGLRDQVHEIIQNNLRDRRT